MMQQLRHLSHTHHHHIYLCAADSEAEGFVEGASNIEGRPHIFPMPEQPLETLKTMHVLLGALVEDLHQLCVEEQRPNADAGRSYSVLNQDPKDWVFEVGWMYLVFR